MREEDLASVVLFGRFVVQGVMEQEEAGKLWKLMVLLTEL